MLCSSGAIDDSTVNAVIDGYVARLMEFVKGRNQAGAYVMQRDFEDVLNQFFEHAHTVPGLLPKLEALKLAPDAALAVSPAACVEFVRSLREAQKATNGPDRHLDQLHTWFATRCEDWFGQLYAQERPTPEYGGREEGTTYSADESLVRV